MAKKHKQHDPSKCRFCHSANIEFDEAEFEEDGVSQDVVCHDCGEVYTVRSKVTPTED